MTGVERVGGEIVLPDGSRIEYRHIQPGDAPALQRFHSRLSAQSVYQRFFGVMPLLSDHQAAYFTGADGIDRVALIALDPADPGEIIGVVRFDHDPGTDRAEYAAIVVDQWQGKGIAYALTKLIVEEARARGINRIYALVLPDNRKMLQLLRDLGLPEKRTFADGVEQVELFLNPGVESEFPVINPS